MPGFVAPLFAATAGEVARWVLAAFGVVFLFGLSIVVHEGGHFAAAKLLGLRADVFSVGFGPALWKKRAGGTEYRVSAIPFGGYVALHQLDPAGMARLQGDAGGGEAPPPPAVWWKRLIVLGEVAPDSAAADAGLRPGDMVLRVADRPVAAWSDLVQEVHLCSEDGFVSLAVSNVVDGEVRAVRAPVSRDAGVAVGTWRIAGISPAGACGLGRVVPGSAAERAGLGEGDVLLSVGGRRGVSPEAFGDLLRAAAESSPDGKIGLGILRGRDVAEIPADADFGADFESFDPRFAPGVHVVSTQAGMPAEKAGLEVGDRIDSVGGAAAESAEQVVSAIRAAGCNPLEIRATRFGEDGSEQELAVTLVPVLRDPADGGGERPMIGAGIGDASGARAGSALPPAARGCSAGTAR